MTASSATDAAAAPQLPVRKLKMAESVEIVLEDISAAEPNAIIDVMIRVCPIAMSPPNGSRHMLPVGRMKPVMEFNSGPVRFKPVNSRVISVYGIAWVLVPERRRQSRWFSKGITLPIRPNYHSHFLSNSQNY
jgi:hypothetical protein